MVPPDLRDASFAWLALDRAAAGVLRVEPDGRLTYANHHVCQTLGYTADELCALTIFDVNPTLTPETWPEHSLRFVGGTPRTFETVHRRRSGSTFPVEVTVAQIRHGGGSWFVAYTRDLTEQKLAEAEREQLLVELAQSQKLESLGRLASGVAHDFNNMLSVIVLCAEGLLAGLGPDAPSRRDLEEILDAGTRSAELTGQLLAFARKRSVAPRPVDLGALVETLTRILRRLVGPGVELVVTRPPAPWPVSIDPAHVDQILTNLVVNARDAVGERGRIVLETRNLPADDPLLAAHGLPPRPSVVLRVTDDGHGMPADVLAHVFEPFFTTKHLGRGTGLGLATVSGLVGQNGGAVRVESAPGSGTTFLLFFPRTEQPAERVTTLAPTWVEPRGTETVLLVEDDPVVLRLTGTALETLGYHVLHAGDAAEALRRWSDAARTVALLVTDVMLPGAGGVELAARVREHAPTLPVLYVSGYAADAALRLDDRSDFLQKPVSRVALAQKVRAILDRAGGDR